LTTGPTAAENAADMELRTFPRLVIEQVSPTVDGGRHPIKRLAGETVSVGAAIYKDGHDLVTARVVVRRSGGAEVATTPLTYAYDPDHWSGSFSVAAPGNYEFQVEAWPDPFRSWRRDLEKRIAAGQDIRPELLEGAALVGRRRALSREEDQEPLANAARVLADDATGLETRKRVAFSQTLLDLMYGPVALDDVARSPAFGLRVDRREAGVGAWYELFPRSQGDQPGRHGAFADTERRVPEIAALGFDVIYLPPIHPIGHTHRKGRNNSTVAEPGDVGSPWAIGGPEGGHTAVHPELGTLEDFRRLVRTAAEFGIEIALDFALQCSPDHPWVKEHPEWFFVRPDGSIRYAENPPKKYEDIYPLNFWGQAAEGLWLACRDAVLFWVEQGVKIFRVDNPHTKPLSFWEWCIREVQERHPEVIFLSESFTRPNRMQGLAKLGFSQSYTYFTWKNTKAELIDYLSELTRPPVSEYYRPNFFANTPDILHEYLQKGGRPAFRIRLLLAATLVPVYGIYAGFELCENEAVHEGSEEYLNSEKYEIRARDGNAPGNIKRDVSRINRIRRSEPALARLTNLVWVHTESPHILAYLKRDDVPADVPAAAVEPHHLLCIVNLDPHSPHETLVHVPLEQLGLAEHAEYTVRDLLTGTAYTWRGRSNFVRLDPTDKVGHLLRIERA
jgi:starch synthase (maltosyl-transferring)